MMFTQLLRVIWRLKKILYQAGIQPENVALGLVFKKEKDAYKFEYAVAMDEEYQFQWRNDNALTTQDFGRIINNPNIKVMNMPVRCVVDHKWEQRDG